MSDCKETVYSESALRDIDNSDKMFLALLQHLELKIIRVTDEYGNLIGYEFEALKEVGEV